MSRILLVLLAALPATSANATRGLQEVPFTDTYCLDAQRVITHTAIEMDLIVHSEFDAFVKSKAIIDGPDGRPEIQQYNWRNGSGDITGISCKLKNTDHLNLQFGPGSAGPEQPCQEMNRQVFALINQQLGTEARSVYKAVIFDPNESPGDPEQPGMTGPEWLQPFTLARAQRVNGNKELIIATKGFVIEFGDPRYAQAPERFRGIHYCHFIAPLYLQQLLDGNASPPAVIGRDPLAGNPAKYQAPEATRGNN